MCWSPDGHVQGAPVCVAQRISSDLKLNLHQHVLLADSVWTEQDGHATFHPAAPLDTLRVQKTLHDAVLRNDKVLKRKGWQHRLDDPFADLEPPLAELWKAALHGRPLEEGKALQQKALLRGLHRPHGRNHAELVEFCLHANTFVGSAARDELDKLVKLSAGLRDQPSPEVILTPAGDLSPTRPPTGHAPRARGTHSADQA